jgi:hypothetical protein
MARKEVQVVKKVLLNLLAIPISLLHLPKLRIPLLQQMFLPSPQVRAVVAVVRLAVRVVTVGVREKKRLH